MLQKVQHRWYAFTASFTERERVLFLATLFVLGLGMVTALAVPPLGQGDGAFSVAVPSAGGEVFVVGLPLPDIGGSNDVIFTGLHVIDGVDPDLGLRTHVISQRGGGLASGRLGAVARTEAQSRWRLVDVAGYRTSADETPVDIGVELELPDGQEWAVVGPFELRYRVGMRRHAFRWCSTIVVHLGATAPAAAEAESARRLDACSA